MSILVLADHDQGELLTSTAHVVSAAAALGGDIHVLVAGSKITDVAGQAALLDGVAKVRTADSPALRSQSAEAVTAVLERIAGDYSHIAASASAVGRDVLPRLAARLDLSPVTDVVAVHDPHSFDRPVYAGNAIETVSTNQDKVLLTVRASTFEPVGQQAAAAPVEAANVSDVEAVAEFLAELRTDSDVPDLANARIVVGGGQSFGSAENFAMLEKLAGVLGAAIGATRAAVDAGYAPNDWQVGQTGKIIAPDLYIAIGISGALQHLAGIQGAKKIIAINKDPEAPLMKLADLALVGDLFEVVPELTASLEARIKG